jgi:TRAP-type C4-dicarboxylate transport system permease large subunit
VKISKPLRGFISGLLCGLLVAAGWFLWLYSGGRRETMFMSRDEVWKMMRSDLVIAASIFIVVSILVGVGVALLPKYERRDTGDV